MNLRAKETLEGRSAIIVDRWQIYPTINRVTMYKKYLQCKEFEIAGKRNWPANTLDYIKNGTECTITQIASRSCPKDLCIVRVDSLSVYIVIDRRGLKIK